jgi:hypothetical protein
MRRIARKAHSFDRAFLKNKTLQAEHLKPALAAVEAKVPVRSTLKAAALQSRSDHFRAVPANRKRMGRYPLFALLGIAAYADLAGATHRQKNLAASARRLSPRQRAAMGVRRTTQGEYPVPSQPDVLPLVRPRLGAGNRTGAASAPS